MEWILAVIAGLMFAAGREEYLFSLVLGAGVGWLLGRVIRLEQRLHRLERGREAKAPSEPAAASPTTGPASPPPRTRRVETPGPAPSASDTATSRDFARPTARPGPKPIDWRNTALLRWMLSGNVPVKVGVLVSFFGVAFLLKYAVDAGWMQLPAELRLAGVAAFGGVLLGLGWRLRKGHRIYALSIQGGGIGVLYLTAYAGLRLFGVMPATVAFAAMVMVGAGAAFLAIRQDARVLAVLGSVGGFLAPILASTGSGSHVALFSYYLLLNLGIAAVAWFRHWRMLNLVGFTFTFAIGLAWGADYYDERYFASVEPILIAHFLLYTAVAVLSALRQPFSFRGYVDSALVFGLPLVAFPLQAALVDGETRPLAWSATALAVFYAPLAAWIRHQWGDAMRLLSQVYVALAVIFATLAVPLWLDAPWVSNTWALEAAAMIAIGLKQQRSLTHWAGVLLLAAATLAYALSAPIASVDAVILNERFLGGAVLCIAFSFCAWIYPRDGRQVIENLPLHWLSAVLAWGGWLSLILVEIHDHAMRDLAPVLVLGAMAAITLLLERLAARWVPHARVLAASLLPILVVLGAWWADRIGHFLDGWGILFWPGALALLAWLVDTLPAIRRGLLPGSTWLVAALLLVEVDYLVDLVPGIGNDWSHAAAIAALAAFHLGMVSLIRRRYGGSGVETMALLPVLAVIAVYVAVWNLASPGRFQPLAHLPVLNLQLLLGGVAAFLLWRTGPWLKSGIPWHRAALALAFLFVTMEVVRNVHHLGSVPFDPEYLWHSGLFQAALSVVWSIIGIAGMLLGTRLARRLPWMLGAGLMGVVVVKLFLVDLGNSGSLTRVVSFIVVGLLLLVVGYFAPVPGTKRDARGDTA